MKTFALSIVLLSALVSHPAFANKEAGNGGDAILIGNNLYLLDMVEAGVEENPQIDLSAQPSVELQKRVDHAFPQGFPTDLIAKKLVEIKRVNPMMALVLVKTMELYQWKLVNSALLDIADEHTNLKIPRKNIFQLAIRKSASILVDRSLWAKLDKGNQTALVFHEILYALDKPRNTGLDVAPGFPSQYQSSEKAREINGYLFSELSSHGDEGLGRFSDFSHITSSFGDRIYENGSCLKADPFLQIDIPTDEWTKNYAVNRGISLEEPPASADAQIKESCAIAVKNKLPLKLSFYEGSGTYVMLSVFNTFYGQRNYASATYQNGYKFLLKTWTPKDDSACVTELSVLIIEKLQEMKRNYQ